MRKPEDFVRKINQQDAGKAGDISKSVLTESLAKVGSQTYASLIKVNANAYRAKVPKNFQMCRVRVPNFYVEEQWKYQELYKKVGPAKIFGKEDVQLVKHPWDYFYDCHHEEKRLQNVIDQEGMSLWNVLKKVEFDLIEEVFPNCHWNIGRLREKGVKLFIIIFSRKYFTINVLNNSLFYQ